MLRAIRQVFKEPLAVKVPEITFWFWVVKIVTTAGGEVTSDYLALGHIAVGAAVEVVILVVALAWQFRVRRYNAGAYWFLAYAIAIFGTGVADFLHLDLGIPYAGTSALWAAVLAAVFVVWYRMERTLSIHSIRTQRREMFYWATVFATFALGTAFGDFTAASLGLGFLASGVIFGVVILVPAFAWWRLNLNGVIAFWCAYVVTRPLGASFADWFSKPHSLSGLNLGNGPTALVASAIFAVLVAGLVVTRVDVQRRDGIIVPRRPVTDDEAGPGRRGSARGRAAPVAGAILHGRSHDLARPVVQPSHVLVARSVKPVARGAGEGATQTGARAARARAVAEPPSPPPRERSPRPHLRTTPRWTAEPEQPGS